MTECPHCGQAHGYYRICIIKGRSQFNYLFSGENDDNSTLHEALDYKELKKTFCCECQKEIKGIVIDDLPVL
jgi:hypothetical protein